MFDAAIKAAKCRYQQEVSSEAGMAQQFQAIVAGAVVLVIGIFVFSQIAESVTIGDPGPYANNDSGAGVLYNASQAVQGNTGTAFELGAVGVLVAGAVVILSMISGGIGGGGNGGMGR